MEYLLAVISFYLGGFMTFFITGLFLYYYGESVQDNYPDQYNDDKLCELHSLIEKDIIFSIKTLVLFSIFSTFTVA